MRGFAYTLKLYFKISCNLRYIHAVHPEQPFQILQQKSSFLPTNSLNFSYSYFIATVPLIPVAILTAALQCRKKEECIYKCWIANNIAGGIAFSTAHIHHELHVL